MRQVKPSSDREFGKSIDRLGGELTKQPMRDRDQAIDAVFFPAAGCPVGLRVDTGVGTARVPTPTSPCSGGKVEACRNST